MTIDDFLTSGLSITVMDAFPSSFLSESKVSIDAFASWLLESNELIEATDAFLSSDSNPLTEAADDFLDCCWSITEIDAFPSSSLFASDGIIDDDDAFLSICLL